VASLFGDDTENFMACPASKLMQERTGIKVFLIQLDNFKSIYILYTSIY
jgi:hypothetical protein